MSKPRIEVQVCAMGGGCAVFLGSEQKVFVRSVDQAVGTAIARFMQGAPKRRPLTHDQRWRERMAGAPGKRPPGILPRGLGQKGFERRDKGRLRVV